MLIIPLSSKMKTSAKAALYALSLSALALIVMSVSGCAGTDNRASTGEQLDDTAITAKIKSAFLTDDLVRVLDVNVETFRGNVQLGGFVDNEAQKERAEKIARSTPGVTSVTNNITVKGNSTSS